MLKLDIIIVTFKLSRKWEVISSEKIKISSWCSSFLVFLARNCNLGKGMRANKKRFFNRAIIIETFNKKLSMTSIEAAFQSINRIHCISIDRTQDDR